MNARDGLDAIAQRISALQNVIENYIKSKEKEWYRKQERENVPTQVSGIFRLPEAIETQRATDQERYHTTQKAIAVAAWAAFVAALCYAVVAQLQLREMHTQTAEIFRQSQTENADASVKAVQWLAQLKIAQLQVKAAQDSATAIQRQMRQDQRAWVNARQVGVQFDVGKPISIGLAVQNTGKTPARRFHGVFKLEVLNNTEEPTFNYSAKYLLRTAGQILPGEQIPLGLTLLIPAKGTETVQPTLLTQDFADKYNKGQIWIAGEGTISYEDIFGIKHWTNVCRFTFKVPAESIASTPPSANKCANYNNTDDN